MNESNPCDAALAELLTLCVEVGEFAIYYRNHLGQLHRVHGPAVIHTDGTTSWWLNGKRHRDHGPAVIWAGGSKSWYQDGHLHRTDGPANVRLQLGRQSWWLNGVRHRTDGPAIEDADGSRYWFIHGQHLTEEEWNERDKSLR